MGGLERIRISPSGGCCAFVFRTGTVQGVYLRRILAKWASSELLPAAGLLVYQKQIHSTPAHGRAGSSTFLEKRGADVGAENIASSAKTSSSTAYDLALAGAITESMVSSSILGSGISHFALATMGGANRFRLCTGASMRS